MFEYTLIYADRKSISASVKGGVLTVRAPRKTPTKVIEGFLLKHSEWINKNLKKEAERSALYSELSEAQIKELKKKARVYFNEKTQYYSEIVGIKYGRITITSAKSRFGSCSSSGNISFAYRLMLYPEAAREYVIVHELAHILRMDHSKEFYKIVERVLPDYKERRRMLK